MKKTKIAFISLGCSKNLVDSQRILAMLLPECELTDDYQTAEFIFINTCGFIENAKREAIDTILEMAEYKENGKCRKLIVLGCLAERYRNELKEEIPEIDVIVPISLYVSLREILADELELACFGVYGESRLLTNSTWSAYLKIAEGCDNHCSYCSIPLIRKGYNSVPIENLVNEAIALTKQGVKELVLVAQDTTLYGKDIYSYLALGDLLKELHKINDIHWIRVLYMYPALLSEELIDTMKELPKVLMYFDLPLQHGSDRMLKLMNRKGTIDEFTKKIEYLRSLGVPYVLRTTMMVGFPGEADEDFDILLDYVHRLRFDHLGAFIYSPEEDTPAYDYQDQIEAKVAEKRYQELLISQQEIAKIQRDKLLDQVLEVLIEKQTGVDSYEGRCFYQAPEGIDGVTKVSSNDKLNIGEFYQVKIIDVDSYDLFAETFG